ncbi:MHYT domain-containing protein [Streptomonospora nanhaiensis]|uniref:MHYT domain-containing protein n=1 Tax=Streptomonospora nanhaiensis TaxID=1323731 RepID=UPI001C38A5B6|nr:MHYT domain-containing protein [Streptomonospora nanhaiensis]MBV2366771.1 histidine kinase [Streptomonospora nanhaiensis]
MIEHFAYGWTTPAIAYAVSFVGSLVGLQAAARARRAAGGSRLAWVLLGAVCLGAAAIWAMHFIAMMGFSVHATALRYNVVLTVLSGVVAIAVVAVGLLLTVVRPGWTSVLSGGAVMGGGVVAMHYMGMATVQMHAETAYDPLHVAASAAIAVAASTVALLFAIRLEGTWALAGAALVMAAAVSAMHYTAMLGTSVHHLPEDPFAEPPAGATMMDFFLPMFVGLGLLLMIVSLILMLSPRDGAADRAPHRRPALSPAPDSVFTKRT